MKQEHTHMSLRAKRSNPVASRWIASSLMLLAMTTMFATTAVAEQLGGGQICQTNEDCQSHLCLSKIVWQSSGPALQSSCESPTCNNGVQDRGEDGIDCSSRGTTCLRGCACHRNPDPTADVLIPGLLLPRKKPDECLPGAVGVKQWFCDAKGNAEYFTKQNCQPSSGVPFSCELVSISLSGDRSQWFDSAECVPYLGGACTETDGGDDPNHLGVSTGNDGSPHADFCRGGSMVENYCTPVGTVLIKEYPNHPLCIADYCDPTATLPVGASVQTVNGHRFVHLCTDLHGSRVIDCTGSSNNTPTANNIACESTDAVPAHCENGDCRVSPYCEYVGADRAIIYWVGDDGRAHLEAVASCMPGLFGVVSLRCTQDHHLQRTETLCDTEKICVVNQCLPFSCEERVVNGVRQIHATEDTRDWFNADSCGNEGQIVSFRCDPSGNGRKNWSSVSCPPNQTCCEDSNAQPACVAPSPVTCVPGTYTSGRSILTITNSCGGVETKLVNQCVWEDQMVRHNVCVGRANDSPCPQGQVCQESPTVDAHCVPVSTSACAWQGRCEDTDPTNSPTTLGWVHLPDCSAIPDHCVSDTQVSEYICGANNAIADAPGSPVTCPSGTHCRDGVCR
ncbi:MAG: hypothetical protein Q7T03_07715 [Deltaproteobacteria bacterium]|nr:hypothetical protein [Deltaproteobacteria bacterium]